jgi:large subunit ribosomal protein L7/L12
MVTVRLVGVKPDAKLKLIKELKKVKPELGLAAAKKFVEGLPQVVKKGLAPAEATALKKRLEGAGGRVKLE